MPVHRIHENKGWDEMDQTVHEFVSPVQVNDGRWHVFRQVDSLCCMEEEHGFSNYAVTNVIDGLG